MRYLWRHLLRKSYCQYPIPSFIFTIGLVDMMIGGAHPRLPLFLTGAGLSAVALLLHSWQRAQGATES